MTRLIDADELRTVKSIQSADFNSIESIQKWVDNAPTVEPTFGLFKEMLCTDCEKRPQGEWLPNYTSQFMNPGKQCSLCAKIVEFSENYCPKCGAEMRGKEE